MANPHHEQRRREEANEGGLHEHRDDEMSWTDRDDRGDRTDRSGHSSGRQQGESDQHHHHHHHHHGSGGQQSDRDFEKVAEEAHDRIRKGRRGQGEEHHHHHDHTTGQQGGHTGSQSSHREQGRQQSGQSSERRYGSRRRQRGGQSSQHGSPHEGSQRGSDREEGLSGRMTGQRGDSTHHSDPSDSTFRDQTMGQREHRHGGEQGTSERDRRFGSRRGHGSERDRRTEGEAQRHHSTR